jgi:hypothetical protein
MVENYRTEEYDKFIITYDGSKEEFDEKYFNKIVYDKCFISLYIKADNKTIAIVNCHKNQVNGLESLMSSFKDDNLVFEKEQKVRILDELK